MGLPRMHEGDEYIAMCIGDDCSTGVRWDDCIAMVGGYYCIDLDVEDDCISNVYNVSDGQIVIFLGMSVSDSDVQDDWDEFVYFFGEFVNEGAWYSGINLVFQILWYAKKWNELFFYNQIQFNSNPFC